MDYPNNYSCRKAAIEEIEERWNEEIKNHSDNPRYEFVKNEFLEETKKNNRITYIGLLNDIIICDLTVIINKEGIKHEAGDNAKNVVTPKRAYLCAVRTKKEYENQGYFSVLLKYVEKELQKKGFEELSLSVEDNATRANEIYKHLGFNHYIATDIIIDKDTSHIFHYYYKIIKTPQSN